MTNKKQKKKRQKKYKEMILTTDNITEENAQ